MIISYIKIDNSTPVGNPVLAQNLIDVYGYIPNNYAPFRRISPHDANLIPGPLQKLINTYELSDDGVTWEDHWKIVDMTDEEKIKQIERIKFRTAPTIVNKASNKEGTEQRFNDPTFVFNEETLQWEKRPK